MKKKVTIIIVAFAIIVLGVSVLLYGYYNNKSNDNLPDLTSIATMDEAEVNELLVGYRKIQLREVWEGPDETNSNEDVWVINERTSLVVSYNNKDKVVVCGLSTKDFPSLEEIVENGEEWGNEQLQQSHGWTLADVEKVWGKADGELSGMYGYFWNVNDTASVTVLYYDAEIDNISYIAVTEPED